MFVLVFAMYRKELDTAYPICLCSMGGNALSCIRLARLSSDVELVIVLVSFV